MKLSVTHFRCYGKNEVGIGEQSAILIMKKTNTKAKVKTAVPHGRMPPHTIKQNIK